MHYIVINKLITKSIYKQIADSITSAIESGVLKYGDKLPTEKEVCEMFSISQTAVKMAYETLINLGFIKRIKGKGTYVTNRETYYTDLHEYYTLEKDPNIQRNVFLLGKSNKEYSVMKTLSLHEKEKYIVIGTIFSDEKNPKLLQKAYIKESRFKDFNEKVKTYFNIYDFLEQHGVTLKEMQTTFTGYNASSSDALLLGLEPDDAVYLLRVRILDKNNEVVAYITNYYPGEFTEFEVIVHAID